MSRCSTVSFSAKFLELNFRSKTGRCNIFISNFCHSTECVPLRLMTKLWFIDSSFITKTPVKPTPKKDSNAINVTSLSWHSSMNDSNRNLTSPVTSWTMNQRSPQRLSINNSFGNNNTSWQNVRSNTSPNASGGLSPNNSANLSFSSPYKYNNDRDEIIADEKDMQQYFKWVVERNSITSITEFL